MFSKNLLGIVLILLLAGMSALALELQQGRSPAASGKTWYVGPPPSDFSSIQEGINDSRVIDGDTIEVKWNFTAYNEYVNVSKMLTIRHYSSDAPGAYPTVKSFALNANGVEISGFVAILNISLYSSNNKVLNNTGNIHIMEQSCNNTLRQNSMSYFEIETPSPSYKPTAWNESEHFIQYIDPSNTINGKPVYYLVNQHDTGIPKNAGFAAVVNSKNITATNLAPESSSQGLLIVNSTVVTVTNLSLKHHSEGIFVGNSSRITVKDFKCQRPNTLLYNHGIVFDSVTDSCIQNVTFDLDISGDPVILLLNSQNSTVKDTLGFSTTGDFLIPIGLSYGSNGNFIADNVIENSGSKFGGCGITLAYSLSNTVVHNSINGVMWGIAMQGSNGSMIFHNNFLYNEEQVHTLSTNVNNSFDNGFEGNFWIDYAGKDGDGDGIGDTPYSTDYVTDPCPLMVPWSENRTYERPMEKKPIDSRWIQKLYTFSNSTLGLPPIGYAFNRTLAEIALKVTCGYDGFVNVTVPRSWIDGPLNVTIDEVPTSCSYTQNSTFSTLYITLGIGKHMVKISGQELGSITGDLNGNGSVDLFDAIILANNFNTKE
jgi:parallel beta-helix repeat protein